MKIIMFSTDKSAFDENSSFRSRIADYDKLFDELCVIVATTVGFTEVNLSEHTRIIPTNSKIKLFTFFAFYRIAKDILKEGVRDFVITSQEEFSGLVCALLKRQYKVPWQAQIHSDVFSSYFKKFSAKNAVRVFLATRTLLHATRIRVVGKRTKESIERLGILVPIDVLPIFIDGEKIQKIAETRTFIESGFDFVFLVVSRLTPEKNIALAIEAFSEVVKKYPQTTLRIVGDGPERKRLKTISMSLGLGSHVQFEGWQKNISGYLKAADCFILTSWYEGYSLSVMEAMAAKLPIIMTDVGVAGDFVVDNESGLVVAPGDSSALLEAMLLMRSKSNQELRERLGVSAYERVKHMPSRQDYLEEFRNGLLQCLQNKN